MIMERLDLKSDTRGGWILFIHSEEMISRKKSSAITTHDSKSSDYSRNVTGLKTSLLQDIVCFSRTRDPST